MNQDVNPLDLISRDLTQSVSPLILLSQNPSMDAVHAALSLYLGLAKLGKAPVIASSTKVTYQIRDIDLVRTNVGASGDNLVISFPYTDGSIEKVDYRIENNTFNLIVIPRPGFPRVTQEQISFSYSGGKADCIITLDAPSIESLGPIYADQQAAYDQLPLINIDRHDNNMQYGSVNYVIPAVASISQLAFDVMRGVQIAVDAAMATHILSGIVAATANFTTPSSTAEVFADVSELMKLGAVRQEDNQSAPAQAAPAQGASTQRPRRGQQGSAPQSAPPAQSNPTPVTDRPRNTQQTQRPQGRPATVAPPKDTPAQDTASWADSLPQDASQTANTQTDNQTQSQTPQPNTPQDWLKPKIFKGNGLV